MAAHLIVTTATHVTQDTPSVIQDVSAITAMMPTVTSVKLTAYAFHASWVIKFWEEDVRS